MTKKQTQKIKKAFVIIAIISMVLGSFSSLLLLLI